MIEFEAFPKIPRLRREITITEKVDGSNALVAIMPVEAFPEALESDQALIVGDRAIFAGSRKRWITPGKQTDNFGFAGWVHENAEELLELGDGRHYGEWWGEGIQRTYMKNCKTFSLFNTARPLDTLPDCVSQVPVMFQGIDAGDAIQACLDQLRLNGSIAAPWYARPEGIVIWHSASRSRFKVLLEGDELPKGEQNG